MTYAIGYVSDRASRLDVMQNPIAVSLGYELPTQDPVCKVFNEEFRGETMSSWL